MVFTSVHAGTGDPEARAWVGGFLLRRPRKRRRLVAHARRDGRDEPLDVLIVKQLQEPALLHRLVHGFGIQHQLQKLEELGLHTLFAFHEELHDSREERVVLLFHEKRAQRARIVVQRGHQNIRALQL
jgi:hypothetical protein